MNNLRHFREMKGLSQSELSKLSGIDQGKISKVENSRGGFRVETWIKLAEILNCDLQELLGVKK